MPKTYQLKITIQENGDHFLEFQSDGPETEDRAEVYKELSPLELDMFKALVAEWNRFELK